VDNQVTIKSGEMFLTKPVHYLIDHFCSTIDELKKSSKDYNFKVKVQWILGHNEVEGNEKIDEEAKKTAQSCSDTSSSRQNLSITSMRSSWSLYVASLGSSA
jgi:hypothetical protein